MIPSYIKKKYLQVLKKLDVDIIISDLFPTNYFCSLVKKSRKCKIVYYCHEPYRLIHDKIYIHHASFILKLSSYFFKLFFKKYDINAVKESDAIICNSLFTQKKVFEIYGRKGYNYYLGVECNHQINENNSILFKKLNLEENTQLVFSLGLTHHLKGAKELIKILKEIFNALDSISNTLHDILLIKEQEIDK